MRLAYHRVVPEPIADRLDGQSEVWDKELDLTQGKRYQVYAPSGTGKSTFLHCAYGLRRDHSGSVSLDGETVEEMSAVRLAEIRQRHLSIVFQDLRLFMDLTALDNILVKAALYGTPDRPRIDRYAEALGVTRLYEKPANTLSYGERQRFALIRALIQPFDWLLLDEPFAHLDEGNTNIAAGLINERLEELGAGMIRCSLGEADPLKYDLKLRL